MYPQERFGFHDSACPKPFTKKILTSSDFKAIAIRDGAHLLTVKYFRQEETIVIF